MKYTIILIIICGFILAGCASQKKVKPLKPPKSLPENWVYASPNVEGDWSSTDVYYKNQSSPDVKVTSLWTSSPQSLFGDRRANDMGDILTVVIDLDEEAQMQNSATNGRQVNETAGANSLFGITQLLTDILPAGTSLSPAVDLNRSSNQAGNGSITRQEKLTLRLAARVVSVAQNGYLEIAGRQEIMVNNELRYLQVSGLIRKRDISRLNTITYDKIADARIYYGGRGTITNAVSEKAGTKVLDKILPF